MRYAFLAVAVASIGAFAGCDDAGTTTTAPATHPSASEAMEKAREAGREIRDVTTRGLEKTGEALDKAAEKGREAVHAAATRIAESTTATRPIPDGNPVPPVPPVPPVTPP